jgi:hypothetical protein
MGQYLSSEIRSHLRVNIIGSTLVESLMIVESAEERKC